MPVTDPKMEAKLLKVRKRSIASFDLNATFKILAYLGGWKVEKFVGLADMNLKPLRSGDEMRPAQPWHRSSLDEDEVRRAWEEAKRQERTALPTNPVVGEDYYLKVEDLKNYQTGWFGFDAWRYRGCYGWRVTAPDGKVKELLPGRFDVERGGDLAFKQLPSYHLWPWLLDEAGLLDQVNEALGTGAHTPGAVRTRDNTGTCPVCFGNFKLEINQIMVLHGYQRPGWGSTVGRCAGVRYPPFEISPEGAKEHLRLRLRPLLRERTQYLEDLKAGRVEKIRIEVRNRVVYITPADPEWRRASEGAARGATQEIQQLKEEIKLFDAAVRDWEPRPLPTEGQPHVDVLERVRKKLREEWRAEMAGRVATRHTEEDEK